MAAVEEVTEEVELACSPYKTVPQSMIDDVLAVCPEVNPKDVAKDLVITGNPTRTINRILDGQFPAAVSIDTENMPSDLSCMDRANSKGGLLPSKNLATINTATAKMDVHSSSDTENYTHSDDDDVMLLHEERKSLFSALKKRLHAKESNGNCTEKPEIQTHSGASYCKQRKSRTAKRATKRTSTINDTSSSSSDEINACPPLSLNKKSNLAEDCMLAEPHVKQNYRSIYKNTNRDTDYVEGSSMPEATCKFVDSPQPDHDTDNCSESDNFPCIFPSGCHQSELSRVSQSNTPNLSSGSCVDSQDISEIPIKRKKRTAEEVLTQRNEALKKKQAKERERQAKKEAKDKEKQARLLAREQLKTQRDKEKLLKKADSMNQNNNRLDGCIKQIVVCIDPDVLPSGQLTEESILLQKLELLGAGCKLESQRLPGSITWRRAVVEHEVADTLQISAKTTFVDENCAILQLTAVKFVEMVFYFREEMQNPCNSVISDGETLSVFCERTLETYTGKVVTLVIMGLEKYFRDVKLTKQRQFRSAVLGPNSSDTDKPSGKGRKKANKGSEPSVMVSRVDVEEALVDLHLKQPNCRVHMCETEEEFAEMLSMFTKAVAEAPFKKKQPEAFSFCVEGGEKASVKVSKEGEGLKKVWLQHFQQFRNVSADMAAAIVAVYPSPQSLLQAYKRCGRQGEAANLLQDILVRRGAGVLATSRRIGPELSRRVHMLLTSEDGDLPLK